MVKNYRDVLFDEVEIGVGIGSTSGSANYKYKFQGQERQEELGLNWDSFKWRNYMPDIGRFFNPDPLSEKYAYQSHYNFSENRVVDAIELEGLEAVTLKTVLELGNSNTKGLQAVRTNREYINSAASHYGVSSQAIGSIIFQEKSAGIRGDLANVYAKNIKRNGTTSLGLGEMQVDKVAELRGLDADKIRNKFRIGEL
ncbi:RHS repeat domain-containing protein [Empedobacter brevis]